MPQIIESRFRVLEFDDEDALLNDIVDIGSPVHVNKEREEYSETLQNKINGLNPGNVIEAEIQSRSITRQDDIWKFIDLKVTDETRFHFIEDADNHSSHVPELATKAENIGENTARTAISSDGEPIGFITVAQDQGDRFWYGLRMGTNTHEFDIQNLEPIDEPPYEVIYARNSDRSRIVFYHLVEKGTDVAEAVLSANR
ncbi:hypothetical protein EL22_25580 [Halostagnicola sp. A56]|uniref:hypothetical protein n=1 Tax=Halostagnicola sp. A56 TaxID=1495067 RepID=UPI0004A15E43|nr:hypothetical protein [Halostagnicola sp. A56]KDE56655.1 hypothetical protein EL22_25580 [Halostagnicola sp. A56]